MSKFAEYWKGFIAVVGAVAITVQSVLTDGTITSAEWVTIALAVVAAVGVVLKANEPAGQ